MGSTGDLLGNVARLVRELRSSKFHGDIDEVGLRLGDPIASLPLLNHVLLKSSKHVAHTVAQSGYEVGTGNPRVWGWVRLLQCPTLRKRPYRRKLSLCSQQLLGKSDQRFTENAFKLMRDALSIRTPLTPAQFLEQVRGSSGQSISLK